jgi:hypothetical protein
VLNTRERRRRTRRSSASCTLTLDEVTKLAGAQLVDTRHQGGVRRRTCAVRNVGLGS